jgi:cytochrome c biogenesis protein CcmG, thiol:disulfide interchange protein DsbE
MLPSLPMRALAVVLGLAAVAAFAIFGLASSGSSAPRKAPELPAQSLNGQPIRLPTLLAGARGGRVLVVFWASWCGPCEHEAPAVQRVASSPAGSGRIVGVDWSDGAGGARAFLRRYRWTFPNLSDPKGTVGYSYRIVTLPTTFVVNARGAIEQVLHGPQDESSLRRALGSAAVA